MIVEKNKINSSCDLNPSLLQLSSYNQLINMAKPHGTRELLIKKHLKTV